MKTSEALVSVAAIGTNMKSKTIIIHADDAPSVKELTETISRLKKDYKTLSVIRGTKDIEDPKSFKQVIGFLETFLKKGKRKLNKEPSEVRDIFRVSMEMLADLVESEPDLAKQIMEETNFLNRVNSDVAESGDN